jgi:chromate transporter
MKEPLLDKDNLENNFNSKSDLTNIEVFKTCLYLGLTSFGGPIAHIGMFNKIFIHEKGLVSEQVFSELFAVCNVIPGPTSSQLLTAIIIYNTKSVLLGLLSFLCFNLPSLILMITIASLIENSNFSQVPYFTLIKLGVWQGAVAIVLHAAISLSNKVRVLSNHHTHLGIIAFSALFYYFFNSYFSMLVLMLIGAIIIHSVDDKKREEKEEVLLLDKIKSKSEYSILGFNSLLILIFIYFFLLLCNFIPVFSSKNFYLMKSFYEIGASVIGGGHVVIPLIFSHFRNFISQKDILDGFSIVSMLPGPMFNISGYVGTLINGVYGGLLSAFGIFLPGMLFLFFALGILDEIKNSRTTQNILRGISDAAIGFIFTSVIILWFESCYNYNLILGTLNIILAFYLVNNYNMNVIFVIVICANVYSVFSSLLF